MEVLNEVVKSIKKEFKVNIESKVVNVGIRAIYMESKMRRIVIHISDYQGLSDEELRVALYNKIVNHFELS